MLKKHEMTNSEEKYMRHSLIDSNHTHLPSIQTNRIQGDSRFRTFRRIEKKQDFDKDRWMDRVQIADTGITDEHCSILQLNI